MAYKFNEIKLDKGMYGETGKSFTQVLEKLDPSEDYKGTAYDGLDAFQRQLKRFDIKVRGTGSDAVEKFFRTSDSAVLFPEYVARSVRQGMEEENVLPAITATVTRFEGMDYRSIYSLPSADEKSLRRVEEGAAIPQTEVKVRENLVKLHKRGRMLVASYEAVRFQNEIYTEMCKELSQRCKTPVNNGGEMALRLSAVAAQLESLWAQAEWTKNQCFPQTASGNYLDLHAAARGLERNPPCCAIGVLRFETDEPRQHALNIPMGTICLNAAGAEFIVSVDCTIAAGALYCEAPAKARQSGVCGNVPAESVNLMALAPVGIVRCFNAEAFSGGSDGETDEALRKRVIESFASLPNGSNRAYYQAVALDTEGVAAACVIPKRRGAGTVDLVVSGVSGAPSQETIDEVFQRLFMEREICVDIKVLAPAEVEVPVSVTVEPERDYDASEVAVRTKAALEAYFDGRLLGKKVLLAKLGSVVFGVEGVANYSFSQPAADVEINCDQLPVMGAITVVGR